MSGAAYVPVSVAESPEFQQLAADARRWRFLRRYLLRQAPAETPAGTVRYAFELDTPAPIEHEELDRIIDACRGADDGRRLEFGQGETHARLRTFEESSAPNDGNQQKAARAYKPKPCAEPACRAVFQPSGPRSKFCEAHR